MFSRLAGADGEIDPEELQDMLTAALTKGDIPAMLHNSGNLMH